MLRICTCCGELRDTRYELAHEQALLDEPFPKCGFSFVYLTNQPATFLAFKDVVEPSVATNGFFEDDRHVVPTH